MCYRVYTSVNRARLGMGLDETLPVWKVMIAIRASYIVHGRVSDSCPLLI